MTAINGPEVRFTQAAKLAQGDYLINLGRISNVARLGVWVAVEIRVEGPSIATGRILTSLRTRFWHCSDDVVVLVEEVV